MNIRDRALVLLYILMYFVCSISLTFFNKWFFDEHSTFDSTHSFHYPLTVTCLHQFIIFLFIVAFDPPPPPDRKALWIVGLLCGIEWGLSNFSFKYVNVSLYEMVKSTSPCFVLVFSVMLGVCPFSPWLASIVVVISSGMCLSVTGGHAEAARHKDSRSFGVGLSCLICATLCSGMRHVLAQRVLQNRTNGVSLLTTLYYVAPASAASLVLPASIIEGNEILHFFGILDPPKDPIPPSEDDILRLMGFIILSSCVALLLSFTEFLVLKRTSALTLCVAGITKQVVIVLIAVLFLKEGMHWLNGVGFGITLVGIVMYNFYRSMERESTIAATKQEEFQNG